MEKVSLVHLLYIRQPGYEQSLLKLICQPLLISDNEPVFPFTGSLIRQRREVCLEVVRELTQPRHHFINLNTLSFRLVRDLQCVADADANCLQAIRVGERDLLVLDGLGERGDLKLLLDLSLEVEGGFGVAVESEGLRPHSGGTGISCRALQKQLE